MARPRYALARAFKFAQRTAGDVAVASTSWANFDTTLDLTLAAAETDVIRLDLSAASPPATSPEVYFSPVVLNPTGPTIVRHVAGSASAEPGSGFGVPGWVIGYQSGPSWAVSGSYFFTVASGDVFSGVLTLRLRVRGSTATSRDVYASTAVLPLQWGAMNLGPADPN